MVLIHAIVFFESDQVSGKKTPLDYKIYTEGTNFIERKFVREFVEFGSKTLIHKLQIPDNEFIITIADGSFIIYITIYDEIGCALLLSHTPTRLDKLPHLVSKKLICDYITSNIIPATPDQIHQYFKHKELLDQIDDTKKVLQRTLSKILERGEKIEELVEKTEHLSDTSKIFFQRSRQLNSCWGCIPRPQWPPSWYKK
jgi:hypothetical protein